MLNSRFGFVLIRFEKFKYNLNIFGSFKYNSSNSSIIWIYSDPGPPSSSSNRLELKCHLTFWVAFITHYLEPIKLLPSFIIFLSKEKERKKTDRTKFVEKDNRKMENKIKIKGGMTKWKSGNWLLKLAHWWHQSLSLQCTAFLSPITQNTQIQKIQIFKKKSLGATKNSTPGHHLSITNYTNTKLQI